MDFPEYITKYAGKPVDEVVAGSGAPREIITGFETFIKFQTDQAASNGTPAPTVPQLIAAWKWNHDQGNKSITYLTANQWESRERQIVREEVRAVLLAMGLGK